MGLIDHAISSKHSQERHNPQQENIDNRPGKCVIFDEVLICNFILKNFLFVLLLKLQVTLTIVGVFSLVISERVLFGLLNDLDNVIV